MKNFSMSTQNVFEERQKQFLSSKTAARLQKKYTPKTFEERFKSLRVLAIAVSYFANLFSIFSASTFVFSYLLAIFLELPQPHYLAGAATLFLLFAIEALQRILTPDFFKDSLQFGFTSGLWRLALIGTLSAVSLLFSYKGGYDIVKVVKTAPTKSSPTLFDLGEIKTDYNNRIGSAKERAEQYKKKRLWGGRLSSQDSKKYESLLDKVGGLEAERQSKIERYEGKNESLESKANLVYEKDMRAFNREVDLKGGSLAYFAIVAQLLFFLSVFFVEYYDYKVASEFAVIEGVSQGIITSGLTNLTAPQYNSSKIGFKLSSNNSSTRQPNSSKNVLEQNLTASNSSGANSSQSVINNIPNSSEKTKTITLYEKDKYSIKHIDRKTGKEKFYGLSQVNNFIKSYEARVGETSSQIAALKAEGKATDRKEKTLTDRQEALKYWQGRREELYSLLNV